MQKGINYLIISILWLIAAVLFYSSGKTWAAMLDVAAAIFFLVLYLLNKKKKK